MTLASTALRLLADQSRRRPNASPVVVSVVLSLILACSCSSAANGPRVDLNGTLAPLATGGSCVSPRGNISNDASRAGTLSEPSGIDILSADAKLTDSSLKVTFVMAGAIAPTPSPIFVLSQGPAARTGSFEVRAAPGVDPSKPWPLTLVVWKDKGRGTEEVQQALPETADVRGATLSYELAIKDLPPIPTLIWQWGAASGAGEATLFDECNSVNSSTALAPGPTQASTISGGADAGSTAPPTTLAPARFGEAQTHVGGEGITIYEVQDPPKKTKKLDVPIDAGNQLVLVDVQFCASPSRKATAYAGHFGLKLATNQIYAVWDKQQTTVDPTYPDFPRSGSLDAGKCIRGWVSFSLPADAQVSEAFYSDHPAGDDAVIWTLPASVQTAPSSTASTVKP